MSERVNDWQSMDTVPKNGKIIEVEAPPNGILQVRWARIGRFPAGWAPVQTMKGYSFPIKPIRWRLPEGHMP